MTTPDPPKKIDVGAQTEDSVQRFVEDAFSADFVFRSPQRKYLGKAVSQLRGAVRTIKAVGPAGRVPIRVAPLPFFVGPMTREKEQTVA